MKSILTVESSIYSFISFIIAVYPAPFMTYDSSGSVPSINSSKLFIISFMGLDELLSLQIFSAFPEFNTISESYLQFKHLTIFLFESIEHVLQFSSQVSDILYFNSTLYNPTFPSYISL